MKLACLKNGPILVSGHDFCFVLNDKGEVTDSLNLGNFALCRCGQSGNKPFCDGAHVNGFEAEQVELISPEENGAVE